MDSILPPVCFVACCLCFTLHFFNHPTSEMGRSSHFPEELLKQHVHLCLAPALLREVAWACSALNLLFHHSPSQELLRACPSCQGKRALRTALHGQVISPKHNLPENLFWHRARWPAKAPSNLNQSLTNSGIAIKHCREVGNVSLSYPHKKWNQTHLSTQWPTEDLIALSKTLPSSLLTATLVPTTSLSALPLGCIILPWSPAIDVGIGVVYLPGFGRTSEFKRHVWAIPITLWNSGSRSCLY